MTQDVRQWLAEIKSLQQKLAEAQQERNDAQNSAANWRNLYETEARQRRTEARLAQQKINALQAELNALKVDSSSLNESANTLEANQVRQQTIQQQISQLDTIEALQHRLIEVLLEQDRLTEALRSEQAAHRQSRIELTAALGDAIDRLKQERVNRQNSDRSSDRTEEPIPAESPAVLPPSRIPSLELPQFE